LDERQASILAEYQIEVEGLLAEINVGEDGEHLWDNYQKVTSVIFRLSQLHNDIANLEISSSDWPEIKKFRTLIVDPTIERLERIAAFESRKITGKQMEKDLERF
jgi:hypothetical protein